MSGVVDQLCVRADGVSASISACKRAAIGELSRCVRYEAVQQAVMPIFGQVDNAVTRVHRSSLVLEPAHRAQRHSVHKLVGVGGHLEHIAVTLIARDRRTVDDFLSR